MYLKLKENFKIKKLIDTSKFRKRKANKINEHMEQSTILKCWRR